MFAVLALDTERIEIHKGNASLAHVQPPQPRSGAFLEGW
jgi:hypothetical protein